MSIRTESYLSQRQRWPQSGQHILAQHDEQSVLVYQAYRPSIADYAVRHGRFGGADFSFARMSWIKPNFLWMMYRAGWATKPGQERILGLRIARTFFEQLLEQVVASTYQPDHFADHAEWQAAVANSDVRMQWDPDHSPTGAKESRRAIQLGLRGEALRAFAAEQLLEVIDLSDFVATQRVYASEGEHGQLLLPLETVYQPASSEARSRTGVDPWPTGWD